MRKNELANITLPLKDLPAEVYQAIYAKLTSRPDRIKKDFIGAFRLEKESIEDLVAKLVQAMASLGVKGARLTLVSILKDDMTQRWTTLERFSTFNQRSNPRRPLRLRFHLNSCSCETR